MMIKTAWDEVTKKTILNCFGKSEILLEVQTNAMNNHDDPFKEIMDDAEDDCCRRVSVWTESTWRTRSDLASENLDADGLVDFDRDVATNEFWPLSVDETVKEYLPQLAGTVENISSDEDEASVKPISPTTQT